MTKKLPITLCVITHNSEDRIQKMLQRHRDFCDEILVIDQSSTDKTREEAEKVADTVITRRCKGTADADRNWLFNLARNPWVIYLDDDEYLDHQLIKKLPELIEDNIDIYWIKEKNLVDGIDVKDISGDDPHPRLFKRGSIRFPDKIHTFPTKANDCKVAHINYFIVHDRSLEKIKAANRERNVIASPEQIQMQENFISQVEKVLKRSNG